MWFAGVHCDAGGGYEETGLSDITLLWMVGQARRHGLEFDEEALSTNGPAVMRARESTDFRVRPDASGALHVSRTGMYRLAEPFHRTLGRAVDGNGEPDGNEFLAVPAKERLTGIPSTGRRNWSATSPGRAGSALNPSCCRALPQACLPCPRHRPARKRRPARTRGRAVPGERRPG